MYSNKKMKSALESMMYVWGEPLSVKDAASVLETDRKTARELFQELKKEYEQEGRGIRIRQVNDSFQFVTYEENEEFIEKLCRPVKVKRLSQAALEVLAIIAYRQPVTRAEIDAIRGIKSDRVIDGLMNRSLVEVCGKSEGIGRPNLYGTTDEFLKTFGFETLKDLPEIEGFSEPSFTEEDAEEGETDEADDEVQLEMNFDESDESYDEYEDRTERNIESYENQ